MLYAESKKKKVVFESMHNVELGKILWTNLELMYFEIESWTCFIGVAGFIGDR